MKLFELATRDFFDHSNPSHVKMMQEIDAYTSVPMHRLKDETVKYLESKYANKTGAVSLYRAMVFRSLDEVKKMFGVNVEGATFTYKRDKESSWTKRKSFAYRYAEEGDLDEQFTVVIKAPVPQHDFLLDMADLSAKDLEQIYLEDQAEVIVNSKDRNVVIDKIIDNWE